VFTSVKKLYLQILIHDQPSIRASTSFIQESLLYDLMRIISVTNIGH